ncbi:MAG TPA: leucyl aminopeptidase family protein [Candidatus Cybelea sp.]|nr:leucyl aminopeptidase family protein [Candidatus Cybelea sp.]
MNLHLADPTSDAIPLWPVTKTGFDTWVKGREAVQARWIGASGFKAKPGKYLLVPGEGGRLAGVVVGIDEKPDLWAYAGLPRALPAGIYQIQSKSDAVAATRSALGWALGTYGFDRYREKSERSFADLVWPDGADRGHVERAARAIALVRDLINTPASDMGPAELAEAAQRVASANGADCRVTVGDDLLTQSYPMVHAVGRASSRKPRMIDMIWGNPAHPKVTLVGKGVCFDSGGLDIKPASGMALMKKDMGGGAMALGLASLIMASKLPLRLRVMVPAVENAVGSNAFRPGDVLRSRKGITVEIGNTDAEGRLVLGDALADADAEAPELMIDFATLTGAARTAVGPDLPALFTDDDQLAADLARHGAIESDPHWRLPLYKPYRAMLDSKVADINNAGEGGMAGAITAALFLKEFVAKTKSWAHVDLYAWNQKARPGRPAGGEAMMLRAVYALLAERYGRG